MKPLSAKRTRTGSESDAVIEKLVKAARVRSPLMPGDGRIEIRVELDENHLLVEVLDAGNGFERSVREQDFERVGGRGLHLVDALASRWGIHEGSSHVWYELERRGPRLGPANKPRTDS